MTLVAIGFVAGFGSALGLLIVLACKRNGG